MSVDASDGRRITDGRADLNVIQPGALPDDVRIAIVAARFNDTVVNGLLKGAFEVLDENNIKGEHITVVWVPGAYEIPLAAQRLASSGGYDAVITFGAVIRGDTPHFDFVAGECARGVTEVSLNYDLPVLFGVLTTDTLEQAMERCGERDPKDNKGRDVALAALQIVSVLVQIDA